MSFLFQEWYTHGLIELIGKCSQAWKARLLYLTNLNAKPITDSVFVRKLKILIPM